MLKPFGGQNSQGIHGKKSIGLGSHPKMSEKNLEPFVMDSMDWVPVDWPKIHFESEKEKLTKTLDQLLETEIPADIIYNLVDNLQEQEQEQDKFFEKVVV